MMQEAFDVNWFVIVGWQFPVGHLRPFDGPARAGRSFNESLGAMSSRQVILFLAECTSMDVNVH